MARRLYGAYRISPYAEICFLMLNPQMNELVALGLIAQYGKPLGCREQCAS